MPEQGVFITSRAWMKSLQNGVLTAVTETASLPGFTYAKAVTVPDKLPVGRNSAFSGAITEAALKPALSFLHNLAPL